jgi:hypothetical protein
LEPCRFRILGPHPHPQPLHGRLAGFDDQFAVEPADGDAEKIEPLGEVNDPGLILVEPQTPWPQPIFESISDLLRLDFVVAEHHEVVSGLPRVRLTPDL